VLFVDISRDSTFKVELEDVVERGLVAAALVDRHGNTVDFAGAISEEEAMPLAALVMFRLKSSNLSQRLFMGEILTVDLDERTVSLGIAKRQLFVVAVMTKATAAALELVDELNERIISQLTSMELETGAAPFPTRGGGGVSDSGPTEMELIEYGITVPRAKA
jgi:hypothetical protein